MRLAAIYIEDHDYLFEEPQTINFGGKYFYEFENIDENIIVKHSLNKRFTPNFFNLNQKKLSTKITNLNAIVGQNGAGKSSLLDVIRSSFVENSYALPQSKSLFLLEEDGKYPVILRNDFKKVSLQEKTGGNNEKIELENLSSKKPRTIYYSPHYDYKYNPNMDDIDNHDISFDKIVEEDLKSLPYKDADENGWAYPPSHELLFKNSIRQITFLSSDLLRKGIFEGIFEFQEHYEPILYFRGYKVEERDWNTPNQLRPILRSIEEKLKQELSKWHEIRKFEGDKVVNQVEVNQYFLKREVIKAIISLLYRQMERKNSFLNEGFFPDDELKSRIETASAYETLLLFAEHAGIEWKGSEPENIFSQSVFKNLLEKIYTTIEKTDKESAVSQSTLRTSPEDAVEILNLQRQFLIELNSYYVKYYPNKDDLLQNERTRIEEFINYMPFSRKMSSGEGALLNFFSRIYDFLNVNLKELKYRPPSDHYILLLDEADLTFHITWKKKYVKALLSTLPYFFDELNNKPTLEVIFTTHDPITLSDLPNSNVIYIERPSYNSSSKILDFNNKRRPLKTFGANISELITDSFFVEDSLIGDFVFDKIQETIKWLNGKNDLEKKDYYKTLIKMIDEPIVQRKLAEMYDDKIKGNFQKDVIDDQIRKLKDLKKRLGE